MEFQCNGKCRRNWLADWEWATYATGSYTGRSRAVSYRHKGLTAGAAPGAVTRYATLTKVS